MFKNKKLLTILLALALLALLILAVFLSSDNTPSQPTEMLPVATHSTVMAVGNGRYTLRETSIPSEQGTPATKAVELTLYYNSGMNQGELEPALTLILEDQQIMMVTGQTVPFMQVELEDFANLEIALGEKDCLVNSKTQTFSCN